MRTVVSGNWHHLSVADSLIAFTLYVSGGLIPGAGFSQGYSPHPRQSGHWSSCYNPYPSYNQALKLCNSTYMLVGIDLCNSSKGCVFIFIMLNHKSLYQINSSYSLIG